jgi:hypothetical protein
LPETYCSSQDAHSFSQDFGSMDIFILPNWILGNVGVASASSFRS